MRRGFRPAVFYMQCFLDYITFPICQPTYMDGPAATTPEPLYITQLPGITFKLLDSLVEADQITIAGLFSDVQSRALRRFRHDYNRKFAKKYEGFCCSDEDCDPEKIACDYKELFQDAWLYCLGIELMHERLYSSRLNRFTTIDKEQAAELKDFYTVEYEKFLNGALCELPKEVIEKCFRRTASVERVEALP
jgi:hypothetical protein